MKTLFTFCCCLFLFTACNNDDTMSIVNSQSNGVFEKSFVAFNYSKNGIDTLKITIHTTIIVELDDDINYPNGLHLVVNQNFRVKNSFNMYNAAALTDTLFVPNHTNRQIILTGNIGYISTSHYIENPEVILHDQHFTFY